MEEKKPSKKEVFQKKLGETSMEAKQENYSRLYVSGLISHEDLLEAGFDREDIERIGDK